MLLTTSAPEVQINYTYFPLSSFEPRAHLEMIQINDESNCGASFAF
jgi:hypothetical protein